ncbi:MAG: efflux RND transporter periplasmic adaptor subunit [Sandarakinorhabdus sp.]|nr:efflux RND transporter periplasmic adaptor subunit [Sandarakinorhabdus sp.]
MAIAGCGKTDNAARKKPPQVVGAMPAKAEYFAPRLVALGTVTPLQSVAVRPRSDGEITRIMFREGDDVRAGQPLFQLDDRAQRAALGQAQANLASARAAAVQARGDFQRAQQLVGKGFVSAAVLDQRRASAGTAEAAIAAARAEVQSAQTALSFQTIRAPVGGRTGELGFRLGANVRNGETVPLVTVNQLSPISVRFLVPPEQVQDVRSAMGKGGIIVVARPQDDGGDAPPLATGRLSFLDNNVNAGTGSVTAKAEFVNAGARLWPGAIITVELPLAGSSPRIALPEAAVQTGRDSPFVWAIGPDHKIAMRDVTVAGRVNGKVFLASGVAPGESIIVDTLTKLRPGDTVRTRAGRAKGTGLDAPRTVATTAGNGG